MRTLLVLLLSLIPAGAALGDDADRAFNELFGERLKTVTATRETDDDIAFASELLASAGKLKADEPLLVPLYNHAYELGSKAPRGYDTAITAMRKLGEQFPAQAMAARTKTVSLLTTAYLRSRGEERTKFAEQLIDIYDAQGQEQLTAGDYREAVLTYREALKVARAIRSGAVELLGARLEQAVELVGAQRRKEQLENVLDSPPVDPKVVRELVQIRVAKFNQPEPARIYAPLLDAATNAHIAAAIKAIDEVPVDDCFGMGEWYIDFATTEKGLIKRALLDRAAGYLSRYLEAIKADNSRSVDALKAELALKKVKSELETLPSTAGSQGQWLDLTQAFARALAENRQEVESATVTHKDGVFVLDGEKARIAVPVAEKNVIFSVEIRKIKGEFATVATRVTDDGSYWVALGADNTFAMNRWLRVDGRSEITRDVFKQAFDGKFHEVQFAALGDTLITYLDGKEILRARNSEVAGPGNIALGVRGATAEFRKPRVLAPPPSMVAALLAKNAVP